MGKILVTNSIIFVVIVVIGIAILVVSLFSVVSGLFSSGPSIQQLGRGGSFLDESKEERGLPGMERAAYGIFGLFVAAYLVFGGSRLLWPKHTDNQRIYKWAYTVSGAGVIFGLFMVATGQKPIGLGVVAGSAVGFAILNIFNFFTGKRKSQEGSNSSSRMQE